MKEQFVTYEIAQKLKDLGFNKECLAHYKTTLGFDNVEFNICKSNYNSGKYVSIPEDFHVDAPLWQQVIDWFREKFKYHIEIQSPDYQNENDFYWTIHVVKKIGVFGDGSSDNYYEAREQAILKAIELCQKER